MPIISSLQRDVYGNITIHMEGDLNYEYSLPLRQKLEELLNEYPEANLTIDFSSIDFVGSSGICHFVETLKMLAENRKQKIKLAHVKKEFIKVFRLFSNDEDADQIIDLFDMESNDTQALNSLYGNRRRTFQN